ncbi:Aste57867_22690 [Aphanomyces stellatus]|uniref:histone deacetylase n=1 Tax=Aphanomyces stellatus TaxID=120398 RepID=A0A485LMG3_9STRA|nr:hypothetical protein As57867_022620 [Aphanomyces stellatus]VFT99344.1 Aste57867_22690 [Aphanomyces stellatus]
MAAAPPTAATTGAPAATAPTAAHARPTAAYFENPIIATCLRPFVQDDALLQSLSPAWDHAVHIDAAARPATRTLLLSHPACVRHCIKGHPERPERVQTILDRMAAVFPELPHRTDAPAATLEQLHAFHTSMHVNAVLKWCAKIERSMAELDRLDKTPATAARRETLMQYTTLDIDGDTALMRYTREAALHAAGTACTAVDAVLRGDCTNAFCAIRPPGHHAEPFKSMGFCIFNNVGVAAMHAVQTHGLARVAIVDFDVHHGNGTETKAKDVPQLLYVSTHQAPPCFPGTGYADNNTHNIWNVEMKPATSSAAFRHLFVHEVEPTLRAFHPELILVSAGFDAHANDPMANVNLCADDYYWVTLRLKAIAATYCRGRLVSVLEGGYHLRALGDSVEAHVRALLTADDENDELSLSSLQLGDATPSMAQLRVMLSCQGKQKLVVLSAPITMDQLRQQGKAKMKMKKSHVLRTKHGAMVETDAALQALANDVVLYMS